MNDGFSAAIFFYIVIGNVQCKYRTKGMLFQEGFVIGSDGFKSSCTGVNSIGKERRRLGTLRCKNLLYLCACGGAAEIACINDPVVNVNLITVKCKLKATERFG